MLGGFIMKKLGHEKSSDLRKDRNFDLIRRMQSGEPISSFNSQSSWYPPRPVIEKDGGAIAKLYGDKVTLLSPADGHAQSDEQERGFKPLQLA